MRSKLEIDKICKDALEEYLNTPEKERSLTKLQTKYNVRRQILSERFKLWGIDIKNQQNRLRINETVFDYIDSEDKAYWLGFIFADGNIGKNEYKLEINLSSKDSDHMKKFQNFLEYSEDKLRIVGDKVRFSIRNKHIWEALNSKGCVPCKSLILKFLDENIFSNKKLIYDFIRGYVDGDGCLTYYLNSKKTSYRTELNIIGTKEFLEVIEEFLETGGYIRNKSSEGYTNKAYSLSFSDVASRKIVRLLYENSTIYLDRKYNKYLEFCRLEEESSRRLSSKIGGS